MSQLEPMVKELQQMTSAAFLTTFFMQIEQQYQYPFCGLILWRTQQKAEVFSSGTYTGFAEASGYRMLQQLCYKRCTPVLLSQSGLELLAPADDALLIPVHGVGMDIGVLIIGMKQQQTEMAQHIAWYWSIIATYLYEAVCRLARNFSHTEDIALTSREIACLSWAAKGKTSWEISQILSISERTVNFHLGNCISKTNSNNRQQAISRCIAAGHIYI